LREKQNIKSVPIIAVTSHADECEWQEKCWAMGMNEVSGKPNAAQLSTWIKQYVDNNQVEGEST
jgi:CheY-like chemotaxis protein